MSKLEVISLTLVDLVKTPLLIMLFLVISVKPSFTRDTQTLNFLFHKLVNGDDSVFHEGLLFFFYPDNTNYNNNMNLACILVDDTTFMYMYKRQTQLM